MLEWQVLKGMGVWVFDNCAGTNKLTNQENRYVIILT